MVQGRIEKRPLVSPKPDFPLLARFDGMDGDQFTVLLTDSQTGTVVETNNADKYIVGYHSTRWTFGRDKEWTVLGKDDQVVLTVIEED